MRRWLRTREVQESSVRSVFISAAGLHQRAEERPDGVQRMTDPSFQISDGRHSFMKQVWRIKKG